MGGVNARPAGAPSGPEEQEPDDQPEEDERAELDGHGSARGAPRSASAAPPQV